MPQYTRVKRPKLHTKVTTSSGSYGYRDRRHFGYHVLSLHSQTELIVLIGFMGAGKSTVGRTLARRLGWTFVDLDRWIERHEGRKIAQIFEAEGEAAFRAMESMALATVVKERSAAQVLAVGGGTWVQPANAAMLKAEQATVVFLD